MPEPKDYTIGWICALSTEYVAAQAFLDEKHDKLDDTDVHDDNDYTLGRIGKHNIVVVVLPHGQYGLVSAATVAKDLARSFPNIRFCLMVGVGGGVPTKHDIRLGDVVVSSVGVESGGVLQYDYGKTIQDKKFTITGHLNQPPLCVQTAMNGIIAQYEMEGQGIEKAIDDMFKKHTRLRKKYQRPDSKTDRLYRSSIVHKGAGDESCADVCGNGNEKEPDLVPRIVRSDDEDNPAVHYGLIASANRLMKDALLRDNLAAERDVLCFEMEAAGLMNQLPCLVIRGICDYSDSHKNKAWQGYAAMTAAAYAKELLNRILPNKVQAERKLGEVLDRG